MTLGAVLFKKFSARSHRLSIAFERISPLTRLFRSFRQCGVRRVGVQEWELLKMKIRPPAA